MPVYNYEPNALITALKAVIDFVYNTMVTFTNLLSNLASYLVSNVNMIKSYIDANSYAVDLFKSVYGAIPGVITSIFFLGMIIYVLFRLVRAL